MPSRLLYLGCQPGQDVMDLQDGLNAVTALPAQASACALLVVDGVFGSLTAARVREFQQHNGLASDGVVGAKTWAALLALLQSVPGLQIGRPIGGTGAGPAKGTQGEAVYGKTGASGGGSYDNAGKGGGSKSGSAGGAGSAKGSTGGSGGKSGSGNHDGGGSKEGQGSGGGWAPWAGAPGPKQVWEPAYKGNYKSSGGDGKSGGGGGGGSKGG